MFTIRAHKRLELDLPHADDGIFSVLLGVKNEVGLAEIRFR